LQSIGVRFIQIPMARTGLNPFADLRTLVTVALHDEAIVYGCLAARIVVFYITSPSSLAWDMYLPEKPQLYAWRSFVKSAFGFIGLLLGVWSAFSSTMMSMPNICKHRMLLDGSIIKPVPGSGVDLDHFAPAKFPKREFKFLLIARLQRIRASSSMQRRRVTCGSNTPVFASSF
jgi:hypothetical protein